MIQVAKYPSIKVQNSKFSMFVKFKYDPDTLALIKSLPSRYYEPTNKVWEVPISDMDRLVGVFGKENIEIFNDFPELMAYLHLKEIKKESLSLEEKLEFYKNITCDIDYTFKTKPDGHQIECFNKGIKLDSMIITDVMGLGKTKEAIDLMDYRKSVGQIKHVLVICGVNNIKYNWHTIEIPKHSKHNSQVIDGSTDKKLEKLNSYWMFFYNIINIESLRNKKIVAKLSQMCESGAISGIIVDEFHRANNHKSEQGKGLRELNAKYKIALSGTPITKRIDKSWSILNWMGLEESSYWGFKKRYCHLGGWTGYEVIGYKNLDELHERFDQYQIRRTKDILCLPPKTHQTIYLDMTTEEHNEYKQIKRGIIRDLESGALDKISPMAATIKLRFFTDTIKARAIKETIEELKENDQACVVFSMYKEALYSLANDIRKFNPLVLTGDISSAEQRQQMIKSFQEDAWSDVLIGTIQALGTGYTLTRSQYVLFLNKSWIVGENEQAEDRCHRRGTTGNVTVVTYIVRGTIDERVEDILKNDKVYIDKVIDGVPIFKNTASLWDTLLGDD